jgi:hypothetical protein
MISPHTKPGTLIVCIDAEPTHKFMIEVLRTSAVNQMSGLRKGSVYTVASIVPCDIDIDGLVVVLDEIDRCSAKVPGFSLRRFKIAVLPSCLTDALTSAPVDSRKLETV